MPHKIQIWNSVQPIWDKVVQDIQSVNVLLKSDDTVLCHQHKKIIMEGFQCLLNPYLQLFWQEIQLQIV